MGIVERAADMLGSVDQPQRKHSTEQGSQSADSGLIERGVSDDRQRPDFRMHLNIAEEDVVASAVASAVAPAHARAAGQVSRKLKIDLGRLRQQGMITPAAERTPMSESFRRIKRRLLATAADPAAVAGANRVMITSALPKEGKTFCSINLAISIAMETDRTVLLVDADVRRPSITSVLGIKADAERGFMDVLLDGVDVAEVLCRTDIGKLSIMPAGTPHAHTTEALASDAMRELLDELAGRYSDRILIFDSPPLLVASEASVLASHMGQILVVVEAGKTTESALRDALSRIDSGNVVGVLLNKGSHPGSGFSGGQGYGYGESE